MHGGDIYRNGIALDFSVNGNPFGVSGGVREALEKSLEMASCYPDLRAEELRHAISDYIDCEAEEVCVGNGASELFMAIAHGVLPKRILLFAPSFQGYEWVANAMPNCEVVYAYGKSEEGFCISQELTAKMDASIDLMFVTNPNNPTGTVLKSSELQHIFECAEKNNITIVIDESFIEFVETEQCQSAIEYLNADAKGIVVRGFTKICAIPGVRLGYAICKNTKLRHKIRQNLPEWNISVMAQYAGVAAVKDLMSSNYLSHIRTAIKAERERVTKEFVAMGCRVFPSQTNYLFFHVDVPIAQRLLDKRILIRDCSDYEGLGEGYYRIAIRSPEENDKLLEALRQIL